MYFITHFIFFVFFACSNPLAEKSTPEVKPTTSTTTTYNNVSGNAVKNVDIGNGKNFKIKKGESAATTSATGTLLERYKKLGNKPEMVIALWLEAAIRAQLGQEEGWKALGEITLYTKDERLKDLANWKGHHSKTYFVKAINTNNPAFRSFVVGADPENKYEVDLNEIKINVVRYGGKEGLGHKFFIHSSGSPMPRPISLLVSSKTGQFVVYEYSSMYVGVQPPVDPDKETFE